MSSFLLHAIKIPCSATPAWPGHPKAAACYHDRLPQDSNFWTMHSAGATRWLYSEVISEYQELCKLQPLAVTSVVSIPQADKPYLPITVLPSSSLVFPSAFRWSIFCSTQSALRMSAIWVHEFTPTQMGSNGSNGLRVKQVAFLPVSSLNNTAPGLTPHPHCCRHHKRSKAIK